MSRAFSEIIRNKYQSINEHQNINEYQISNIAYIFIDHLIDINIINEQYLTEFIDSKILLDKISNIPEDDDWDFK